MDNKETIVEECRIQKVGDKMSTIKTKKRSLNNFDDKIFYLNNIRSYPHDKRLDLFKRDLIKKNNTTAIKLLKKLEFDESKAALINNILELLMVIES